VIVPEERRERKIMIGFFALRKREFFRNFFP